MASLINYSELDSVFDNISNAGLRNFLINKFKSLIRFYDLDVSNFAPFVTGYNLIIMVKGPWYEEYRRLAQNNKYGLSIIDNNEELLLKKNFSLFARNINIPEPTKEYQNVTTRSTTISHYIREVDIPDFSIDYIDNHTLVNFKYHENWYKIIELYRRVLSDLTYNINNTNPYFYDVPYMNAIWILGFTPAFDIRYLFYLPGIRPVNLPLKSLVTARGEHRIVNYSINYKGTKLFYKFFRNNKEISDLLNNTNQSDDKTNVLLQIFKNTCIISNDDNSLLTLNIETQSFNSNQQMA